RPHSLHLDLAVRAGYTNADHPGLRADSGVTNINVVITSCERTSGGCTERNVAIACGVRFQRVDAVRSIASSGCIRRKRIEADRAVSNAFGISDQLVNPC